MSEFADRGELRVDGFAECDTGPYYRFFVKLNGSLHEVKPHTVAKVQGEVQGIRPLHLGDSTSTRSRSGLNAVTEEVYGDVAFIGTEIGDDVAILLRNGSVILYYVASTPPGPADDMEAWIEVSFVPKSKRHLYNFGFDPVSMEPIAPR